MALYYYLLVARQMYIEAPERRQPIQVPALLAAGIGVCVLRVVGMGVCPDPWVTMVRDVAAALF